MRTVNLRIFIEHFQKLTISKGLQVLAQDVQHDKSFIMREIMYTPLNQSKNGVGVEFLVWKPVPFLESLLEFKIFCKPKYNLGICVLLVCNKSIHTFSVIQTRKSSMSYILKKNVRQLKNSSICFAFSTITLFGSHKTETIAHLFSSAIFENIYF